MNFRLNKKRRLTLVAILLSILWAWWWTRVEFAAMDRRDTAAEVVTHWSDGFGNYARRLTPAAAKERAKAIGDLQEAKDDKSFASWVRLGGLILIFLAHGAVRSRISED